MAKPLLTNEIWQRIEPHIPPESPKPKGDRTRVPHSACLTGILFVLKTGTPWEYDAEEKIRKPLRQRKTKPLIAKRYTKHDSGLGKFRHVVEAAFDWLFNQRRLRVRNEKRDDIHQAFLILGCFLICWRRIMQFC